MRKAFEIAGYGPEVLEERFGGMYRAFQCGAPPHGGIAPGVDRIVMLLAGEENLREVVLFPMNQRAEDLLMGAPAPATPKQLRELRSGSRCRRSERAALRPRPRSRSSWACPCGAPHDSETDENRGIAQPGSAEVLGTSGRRFKSCCPDHLTH